MVVKGARSSVSGAEEEARRQPDGGLIAAFATDIGFMRHDGVILRVPEADVDVNLGLGGRQEGAAGADSPSARRLVRSAITDHPAGLGSFINTGGSPSRNGAITSPSKRHLPPLPPFSTTSLCCPEQHDNPPPSPFPPALTVNMAIR